MECFFRVFALSRFRDRFPNVARYPTRMFRTASVCHRHPEREMLCTTKSNAGNFCNWAWPAPPWPWARRTSCRAPRQCVAADPTDQSRLPTHEGQSGADLRGRHSHHWPKPGLDLQTEMQSYQPAFDAVERRVGRRRVPARSADYLAEAGRSRFKPGAEKHGWHPRHSIEHRASTASCESCSRRACPQWSSRFPTRDTIGPAGAAHEAADRGAIGLHLYQRSQAVGGRDPADPGDPSSPRGQDSRRDRAAAGRVRPAKCARSSAPRSSRSA